MKKKNIDVKNRNYSTVVSKGTSTRKAKMSSGVENIVRPLHYINVVKESMNTVRLANSLYVILCQFVSTILSSKVELSLGLFRKEILLASVLTLVEAVTSWSKELLVEARGLGRYTKRVELSLLYGSLLFIASEIFLFASLLSSSFDRHTNQVAAERTSALDYSNAILFFGEAVLATLLLVGSSAALNAYKAHYDSYDESESKLLNGRAVQLLGFGFISLQLTEYVGNWAVVHSNSGSGAFFLVTGFHGAHVIIGLLLVMQQIELANIELKTTVNIGLYYSVVYWHFVDAVWLFVVYTIYCMQTGTMNTSLFALYSL